MSKKNTSKHYVNNPVSANQVVDIKVDAPCLEDLECGTLNLYLQDIYDKLCKELELEYHCIAPTSNDLQDVLQALINKVCNIDDCPTCPDTEETADYDLTTVNLCQTQGWNCASTETCLVPNQASTELVLEELLQGLVSRVLDQSLIIKEHCERLDTLETTVADLQTQILNLNCCE